MPTDPFLGVMLHAVGSLAAGSFYAPLRKVRQWAWESFWLVMGLAAWVVAPWVVAAVTTPELFYVLQSSPPKAIGLAVLFGLLWGLGNLTFGLSVRYLGMALGYSVALGFCMAFGTLIPPAVEGRLGQILSTFPGQLVLAGVAICLSGIALCGVAGVRRERELATATEDQSEANSNQELTIGKGFLVATASGILSACFAFGLAAGKPIAERAVSVGTQELYSNNAVLVVILLGGLTSNALWCLALNARNRSFGDYVSGPAGRQIRNYCLSALGGFIWYAQFFFYGMGTTKLGKDYDFSSWSIHMGLIIVFSNLWGLYFHEWRGAGRQTKMLVWAGIGLLIGSTMLIGYGNSLSV
ncbi:MAG: L-rhamnose/proton symporter RhaT [Planctomycetota bacterium]|nr:L-rhamnose/proton symporter RhaT [Planctomycetota bacterium]